MFHLKSVLFSTFILNVCVGEKGMSTIFLQTFSKDNEFNVSYFNEIYPNIRYNSEKWNPKIINFSQNCEFIKFYTQNISKKYINIDNKNEINLLNDIIYGKFLESTCSGQKPMKKPTRFTVAEVWAYGILTVTFINAFSVLGILFMPLVKKKCYDSMLTFMVSLAVGSLAGTAILILIPDAMKISEMAVHGGFNKNDYKWKATVVFAGLYFFFLTERLFKTILYKKKETSGESSSMSINKCSINEIQMNGDVVTENNHLNVDNIKSSSDIRNINDYIKDAAERIDSIAWMIIFGDALHNFVDGLSIGAAFSFDVITGISVSVATMCEELPHELGDFAVLISAGMTFKEAMFWNAMSAMTCYLGFVIGVIVGEVTSAAAWIFSIAGGMFLYISLVDMMNDIISTLDDLQCTRSKKITTFVLQNLGLWTGYGVILIMALFGDQIQFGH